MEYTEILRMSERLLVTLFGGLSIYLGYRLFLSGVLKVASAEWEGFGLRLKLTRASPGIFFLVIGSIILLQSLHQKVSVERMQSQETSSNIKDTVSVDRMQSQETSSNIKDNENHPVLISKTRFLGASNTREWDRIIASINLAIQTLKISGSNASAQELSPLREMVLRSAFGDSDYEFYTKSEAGKLEGLSGTDRAKWFTLKRRATKIANK